MFGLVHASGASASLLLNFESLLTALIAWWVFRVRVSADRRLVASILVIVAGGVVLGLLGYGISLALRGLGRHAPEPISSRCLASALWWRLACSASRCLPRTG